MDNYLELLVKLEELLSRYESEYESKKGEVLSLEARKEELVQSNSLAKIDKASLEKKLNILVKYPVLIKESMEKVVSISSIVFIIIFAFLYVINNGVNISEVLYSLLIAIGVSAVGSRAGFSPKERNFAKKVSKEYTIEEIEDLILNLSKSIDNNYEQVESINEDLEDKNRELEEKMQKITEVKEYIRRINIKRENALNSVNENLLNESFRKDSDIAFIRGRICKF